MDSILNDIKHRIGPSEEYTYFDTDIIDAINTAFGTLDQLGVGPKGGFEIKDASTTWDDYTTDITTKNLLRTYILNKVRLIFDAPNSSAVESMLQEQNIELEFRLSVQVDPQTGKEEDIYGA